jgi:hypothetical protein
VIAKYHNATDWLWTQEEPANMGAWPFIFAHLTDVDLRFIGRPASGSPATGSAEFHQIRQRKIIEKSFRSCNCPKVAEECRMVCIGNRWKSFQEELEKHGKKKISSKSISAVKRIQDTP